jgi:hypothetical protein
VLKKVHNLRLRMAAERGDIRLSGNHSRLKLRLRASKLIFAEFMDFFSMFAVSFMQRQGYSSAALLRSLSIRTVNSLIRPAGKKSP